jgi:hypothetical protein
MAGGDTLASRRHLHCSLAELGSPITPGSGEQRALRQNKAGSMRNPFEASPAATGGRRRAPVDDFDVA